MFTLLGWSVLSGVCAWGAYPAFESIFLKKIHTKKKIKENIQRAFINGEMYKKRDYNKEYPFVLRVEQREKRLTIVFSIPKGLSPEVFEKSLFVFKQHFGSYLQLDVNEKRGILKVYPAGLPNKITYNYEAITSNVKGKLPVVCGQSMEGYIKTFDMVDHPHILKAGETGSGKSSAIRSILTTLIKLKRPDELRLVLGDLKRSEFHLFKQVEHVEGVSHSAEGLRPHLKKVKQEMTKRGNKLDDEGVNSIDELNDNLPYLIVCIDEVVLLKKETDIMDILEEISSVGRSLGVFVILSMQRPDAKLLDGKLKVNLTVRMGFMTADATNSKIIGTPGSENINTSGRMLLRIKSSLEEIQCPWLANEKAKTMLQPYKIEEKKQPVETVPDDYELLRGMFNEQA